MLKDRESLNSSSSVSTMFQSQLARRHWDLADSFTLVVLFVGLIGNTLTLFIVNSRNMKRCISPTSQTTLFITNIALSDILQLLLKLAWILTRVNRIPIYNGCLILLILSHTAMFTNAWLIVVTSAERALAIRSPFSVARTFNRLVSKLLIGLIWTSCTFYTTVSCVYCQEYNTQEPSLCQTKKSQRCIMYYNFIYSWSRPLLGALLPFILISLFNLSIIVELKKRSSRMMESGSKKNSTSSISTRNRLDEQDARHSLKLSFRNGKNRVKKKSSSDPDATEQLDTPNRLMRLSHRKFKERQITTM